MQKRGIPVGIVLIVSIITCLFLTISTNTKYAPNEIDFNAQYDFTFVKASEKYGTGIDIVLESRSDHNLRIIIGLDTYEPNPKNTWGVKRYKALKEVYLKPGQEHYFSTNESEYLLGATIEKIIVEPASPIKINLTWMAILTLLMFGYEIFLTMDEFAYYDIILVNNLWLTVAVGIGVTITSTVIWMKLFMWITQMLIRVDVLFRILGCYFNV